MKKSEHFSNNLLTIAVIILGVELLIMLVLPSFPYLSSFTRAFLDAVILTIITFPLLYILLFRPLKLQISKRKKIEDQLTETLDIVQRVKKEWVSTVDSLSELICLLDQDGNVVRTNKTVEAWGLLSVKKIRGKQFHDLIHKDCQKDTCRFYSLLKRAVEERNTGITSHFEVHDDQLNRTLHVTVHPLSTKESSFSQELTVIIVQDVSTERRLEKTVAQRQKALQAVYNMSIAMDSSSDKACDYAVAHIAEQLTVPSVCIIHLNGDQAKVVAETDPGLHKGEIFLDSNCPCRAVRENKDIFQVYGDLQSIFLSTNPCMQPDMRSYLGVPIQNSFGTVTGIVSIFDNKERTFNKDEIQLVEIFARYIGHLFERDAIEDQLKRSEKMKVLGQLAAGVAHEVRNPLNAIMAITEAIGMDLDSDPEYRTFLDHIRIQVERLSSLMRELLDLGKPIEASSFNAASIIDICSDTVKLWEQTNTSQGHKVTFIKPSDGMHSVVHANSQKLEQVYYNLIENAVQHSPEGSEVIVKILEPTDAAIETHVIDQGTGVHHDNRGMVFEPFYTTRRGGTGMGLSLVKHIVEMHGGVVKIENNASAPGCTVTVRLPRIKEEVP